MVFPEATLTLHQLTMMSWPGSVQEELGGTETQEQVGGTETQ